MTNFPRENLGLRRSMLRRNRDRCHRHDRESLRRLTLTHAHNGGRIDDRGATQLELDTVVLGIHLMPTFGTCLGNSAVGSMVNDLEIRAVGSMQRARTVQFYLGVQSPDTGFGRRNKNTFHKLSHSGALLAIRVASANNIASRHATTCIKATI